MSPLVQSERVEFANSLRGLACLSVVLSHYCGVFWFKPEAVSYFTNIPCPAVNHSVPAFCLWAKPNPYLNLGPLGVAVFFLISGFVIPYSMARQSFCQFCIIRLLRIWPTYLAGFAVTLLAVLCGCYLFNVEGPFSLYEVAIHSIPGLRDLIGSRNIDGIIWTLEIEVKFYAVCAISCVLLRKKSILAFALPVVLAAFALWLSTMLPTLSLAHPKRAAFLSTLLNLSQFIVFMYIGVVFHYMHVGAIKAENAVLLIASLFIMTCMIWTSGPYNNSIHIAWNYGFAVAIFAFAMSWPQLFRSNRVLDFFADISYPLYVIHGIAGYVLMRTLQEYGWTPGPIIILTTFVAISLAWGIHRLVEKPSQSFGKRLFRKSPNESIIPINLVENTIVPQTRLAA